ncbi:sodium:calcium exchanger [Azospirillum brasilense]|uniref:Sodium:calcium exchanger n=2 Tax=Azospirillum brasilense TaxID=192 RepID=A0A6L3B312_AZOBR|nr:sodium:calcium exchanger [Azospirillum brasilense]
MTLVWVGVLLVALLAAHWGAEQFSSPLKKLRKQWGFSVAAGGAFVGLAAASPEIGINTSSALRGSADIGLGVTLGSNILAIPLMVTAAYLATRKADIPDHQGHERHRREHLLAVDPSAVTVQALPYLAIVALFAILTLPAPWRGLQSVDGWIMLGAYAVYLAQALIRGREKGEKVEWQTKEVLLATGGVAALAVGTYFAVRATENIATAFGLSKIVAGLFITTPVAALPEVFATWNVTRSGQVTSGVTSVMGDHAVTLTIALLPLALVGMPVSNLLLFSVNVAFVALMPILYAAFIHWSGRGEHGFRRWHVFAFIGTYALYMLLIIFWVQPFGGGQGGGQ